MFVKSNGDKYINLDKVDVIEINPCNNVICRIGDKGYLLGTYNNKEEAEDVIRFILHKNCVVYKE